MSLYFRQNVEMRTNLFLCCDLKFRFVNNFYLFLNIAILLLFLNLKLLLSSKDRNATLSARHKGAARARQRSKVPPVSVMVTVMESFGVNEFLLSDGTFEFFEFPRPTGKPGSAPENSPEQAHPCGQIFLKTARK